MKNRMTVKTIAFVVITLLIPAIFTACGAISPTNTSRDTFAAAEAVDMAGISSLYDGYEYDEQYDNQVEEVTEADIVRENSKIIHTGDINLKVGRLEEASTQLKDLIGKYKGYIENSHFDDYYSEYDTERTMNYTVRIPAESYDAFISGMGNIGEVANKSENTEDVTLEYIDVEEHIKALENEKADLEKLHTETIDETIQVNDRISQINYELDSLNGRIKYLSSQVKYSTINVTLTEQRDNADSAKYVFGGIWEKFTEALVESADNTIDIVVFIITRFPLFIIIIFFAFLLYKVAKIIKKKMFKNENRKVRYMLTPVIYEKEKQQKEETVLGN